MGGFCELLTNSKDEFLRTSELLIRFAENVLKDVNNMKYRSIRLKNKIFQERILPFNGAVQCLFEMGFQEVLAASLILHPHVYLSLFHFNSFTGIKDS